MSIELKPPMASVGEISKRVKRNSTGVVHSDKEEIVSQGDIGKIGKPKTAWPEVAEGNAEEEFEGFWREFEQIMEENKRELEGEIKTALVEAERILPILREIDAELAAKGGHKYENRTLIREREEYVKEAASLEALLWDDEFVDIFGGWPRNTKIAQELHDYFYKERRAYLPSLEERRRFYIEHPEAAKRFIEECQKSLQEHPNVELSENVKDELRIAHEALSIIR
ncbi:TPA: hypothetical protein EYP70_01880 [Candidatus Bathyarchaeota archaeon]|nr:hypothetical protein [Candidatus Bathyarchaeota archaeon]